jgi:hypothetical protein
MVFTVDANEAGNAAFIPSPKIAEGVFAVNRQTAKRRTG